MARRKQNKFTPEYKRAVIDSVVQALDDYSTRFTKNDIRREVENENFLVTDDTLSLTSYRPVPRFRLDPVPKQELLTLNRTPSKVQEVEGTLELV